jgi:putative tricarboxylic transport membrane protein
MQVFIEAILLVAAPDVIIAILASAVYGLVLGSLPGLSATMATALLVPVTFYLSPIAAIATIVTASAMAIFSGDIPAPCCGFRERRPPPPMPTKPTQ